MRIIIDLALDGFDAGATEGYLDDMVAAGRFPGEVEIDYIRTYKKAGEVREPSEDFVYNRGWTSQNIRPRFLADINGDGRSDIIGFGYQWMLSSLSQSTLTDEIFNPIQYLKEDFTFEQGYLNMNVAPRFVCDINDDNKADIIGIKNNLLYGSISYSTSTTAHYYPVNQISNNLLYNGCFIDQDATPILTGDFNGDNRQDIVVFGRYNTRVSLSTTANGATTPSYGTAVAYNFFYNSTDWPNQFTTPRFVADINGDGKDDVIGIKSDGVYVSISMSSSIPSFSLPTKVLSSFGTNTGGWTNQNIYPRMMADVNGDGKSDIVGFGYGGVYVSLSTTERKQLAPSFAQPVWVVRGFTVEQGWSDNNKCPRYLADINNDGKADIIGFIWGAVQTSISNSEGTNALFSAQQNSITEFTSLNGWNSNEEYPRFITDINNDGNIDIVGLGFSHVTTYIHLNTSEVKSFNDHLSSDNKNSLISDVIPSIDIYPNPSSGIFNFKTNSKTEFIKYMLYNMEGQLVVTNKIDKKGAFQINLSGYNTGIYIVKLVYDEGVINKRIIVK
jgi:hypothetical protein